MSPIDRLLLLLSVEPTEAGGFRGPSPGSGTARIFGGQVLAQGLLAAARTAAGRTAHSLHGYFLRPGDRHRAVDYRVEELRTGRRFATRSVAATQEGRPIFHMLASFQIDEPGVEHQEACPDVPPPERVPSARERVAGLGPELPDAYRRLYLRERPIELRPIDPPHLLEPDKREPRQLVWLRTTGPLSDDPEQHQAVLAYASDMTLLETCLLPHGISWLSPRLESASLDHAVWFHRPFRADEWLLYVQDSPNASGTRGWNLGRVFRRDGTLVASITQEALIRARSEDAAE